MVATVKIYEITGDAGSKVYTEITTRCRLFSDDVATNQSTPQTANPVVIPTSGFNYSYWKAVCLGFTAGSGFIITNIRHYSNADINWAFGSGGELRRGNRDSGAIGCPNASYMRAIGNAGVTGYAIEDASNGHTYYKSQTTPTADVNDDVAPDGVVVDAGPYTTASPTYANHVALQVKVDTAANGAIQGTQTYKTLTWKYDES
jgi:hypothetical protein